MKNARGYTLVELMVTVGLFSVIMLGVYGTLLTGDVVYTKDSAMLDMESQCRNAVDRIVREVRQASSQTITADFNATTNDKILFTIPTSIGIQYYLNGTNLVRFVAGAAGAGKTIATNVDLLKFTLTGSLLTIQVRASRTLYGQAIAYPLVEKVRLRNE
ncbi:MAG: prepilin-type N-terminal cleavage/methylation domain-containing protein [Candidatus Omnitrophica bacterium]|nr:prepilin-type N-terminal cleavage/methylation domain-containing protein [Candidatus Omnitrophota bacterium]